jgi:hypothetical protein
MACGAISEPLLLLTPRSRSRVAHEERPPDLSDFLKNNTRRQPTWQEIVDFSQSASRPSIGRFRPSGTASDLINRIPHEASLRDAILRVAPSGTLAHFASCARKAKKSRNEALRFAKRNESFRDEGLKSLKSLMAPNHDFAESFVFNGLSPVSFRSFLASALSSPQPPNFAARTAPRQPRQALRLAQRRPRQTRAVSEG